MVDKDKDISLSYPFTSLRRHHDRSALNVVVNVVVPDFME